VLLSRIQTLERDVEARLASGDSKLSPATRTTLQKFREEVREARDARARRDIANRLTSWERVFLKR
jgi:hypothetical protein